MKKIVAIFLFLFILISLFIGIIFLNQRVNIASRAEECFLGSSGIPCTTNDDCPGTCDYSGATNYFCKDKPNDNCPGECQSDNQCKGDRKCQNGKCIGGDNNRKLANCTNDSDCESNQHCKKLFNIGKCIPKPE